MVDSSRSGFQVQVFPKLSVRPGLLSLQIDFSKWPVFYCDERYVHKRALENLIDSIRSDEGLTLETSAFESLYGGQFTLSTQLIKENYLVILPPTQHHSFFRNLPPLYTTVTAHERVQVRGNNRLKTKP